MEIFRVTSTVSNGVDDAWQAGFAERRIRTRNEEVEIAQIGDELAVYDVRTGDLHILNTPGAAIWYLCHGELTLREIANEITRFIECDPHQIYRDCEEFVRQLHGKALVTVE